MKAAKVAGATGRDDEHFRICSEILGPRAASGHHQSKGIVGKMTLVAQHGRPYLGRRGRRDSATIPYDRRRSELGVANTVSGSAFIRLVVRLPTQSPKRTAAKLIVEKERPAAGRINGTGPNGNRCS